MVVNYRNIDFIKYFMFFNQQIVKMLVFFGKTIENLKLN